MFEHLKAKSKKNPVVARRHEVLEKIEAENSLPKNKRDIDFGRSRQGKRMKGPNSGTRRVKENWKKMIHD